MFVFSHLFWIIIGLGLGIPATLVLILNVITKMSAGDNYQLNLINVFIVYIIALVGWAISISEILN